MRVARRIIPAIMALAAAMPMAPARALGCDPICALGGVVTGSNLNLPLNGTFTWDIAFRGVAAGAEGPRQVDSIGIVRGRISSVAGQRAATGRATMQIFGVSPGELLASVPLRVSAAAGSNGETASATLVPVDPDDVLDLTPRSGASGGLASTIAFEDGMLSGAVHVARALPDEGTVATVSITAPTYVPAYEPIPVSGRVVTETGHGLAGIPVQIDLDDRPYAETRTNRNGDWALEVEPGSAEPHAVRAVALRDLPAAFESASLTVYPLHEVEVQVVGDGSVRGDIDCDDVCSALVPHGEQISLTATPDAGNTFHAWTGGCTGPGTICVAQVTYSTVIRARFLPVLPTLVESEPNNSIASADAVSIPSNIEGSLTTSDHDYFAFTLPVAGTLYAETFDSGGAECAGIDTVIDLQTSAGATITSNDDGGTGFCSLVTRPLAAGTYLMRVRPFGSTTASGYVLRLILD